MPRTMRNNFHWKRGLASFFIGSGVVLGGGIPLAIKYGFLAFLSFSGVVAALLAVYVATRSLQLTRETQRPFLTTVNEPEEPVVIGEKDHPRVLLNIKNTGNLPADRISVLCVLYTADNKETGMRLRHAVTALEPPIYFPGVTIGHTFYMENKQFQDCQKGRFTIRILIKYDNKIANKICSTQRSFKYEALTKTPQTPINSTHRDDWWD